MLEVSSDISDEMLDMIQTPYIGHWNEKLTNARKRTSKHKFKHQTYDSFTLHEQSFLVVKTLGK